MRFGTVSRIAFFALLLAAVVALQIEYDATALSLSSSLPATFTPGMVRMIDMGFDPAVASFLWAGTMPEILDLFLHGNRSYVTDLAFLTGVDPKLSYPYAFSVLTLPIVPTSTFPDVLGYSFKIGEEGIANADPDWRIPYYMAINYYLELKDYKNASTYFDIAARTPGVPDYAERFALNFGIQQNERDRVRNLWETVYESSNDPATKARAAAYVERMNDFDYLEAAARTYKQDFGHYPTSTEALVLKGIIPAVPEDPFGFTFIFDPHGVAAIDLSSFPKGFSPTNE